MVKVLHLSDIHLGSGLAHGRINPKTGLNTRLEDLTATLGRCIDRAISEPVDLVIFGGDAFPDATPPPLHRDAFARQFVRLAEANIPTVLLVGNHDQHGQGQEGSSLSIYRTLGVSGFYVGDRLRTRLIDTRGGPVQVTTLPWLNRSTLLTRPEMEGLTGEAISAKLLQRLDLALEAETRQLDADMPAILLVHAMVDTARYGAERHLAVGKGFTVPLSLLARSAYQYVALGHVHKHQVLCDDPPVVYPGSIERVDFSEERETKGFVLAEVTTDSAAYEFVPLDVRRFVTVRVDLTESPDLTIEREAGPTNENAKLASPTDRLLQAIAKADISDCIARLIYRIRADIADEVDVNALHAALADASSYAIHPDVVAPARLHLPGLAASDLDPIDALELYLQTRQDLAGLQADMLTAARALVAQAEVDAEEVGEFDFEATVETPSAYVATSEQLSLWTEPAG
ncbi:MAG: exonuclease subunit SbcD [Cyanobacteria bacterium P01_F01_bin.33]